MASTRWAIVGPLKKYCGCQEREGFIIQKMELELVLRTVVIITGTNGRMVYSRLTEHKQKL